MMTELLLGAIGIFGQSVVSHEPTQPESWEQGVEFRCGKDLLRISGYGAAAPLDRPVQLKLNGRSLSLATTRQLRQDLASRRAVYRLTARCPRGGGITMLYWVAEKQVSGEINYSGGMARFGKGALASYSGLSKSNIDGFMFR
ncbi:MULTISPECIES: hypothetical protein [unclassified Sphingomonas]|jgi:hypothetical protein|nr:MULTISPECIES: hypothetical protein [unclassified Sphingomonas]